MIKKQHYKLWMISDIGINKNNLYIIVLERYILIIDLDTYRR